MKGKHEAQKTARVPLAMKIILIVLAVLLIVVIALYALVAHYTAKLGGTGEDDGSGASLQEILRDSENAESASSLSELIEAADEDTKKAMAEADEALKKQQETKVELEEGVTNYLLIGSDRRGSYGYGNSDVMMIVSVNNTTGKIHLTSLMRAMYVTIPASSGTFNGMLNWAYSMEGPTLAVKTVEENFKIRIDHYACLDFTVFEEVVDAVGGVNVTLTKHEADWINWKTERYVLTEGEQLLDGEQALWHARNRNMDNDFVRTSRQRDIVESILKSMRGLSISQLSDLADLVLPYITTDLAEKPAEVLKIVAASPTMLGYGIDQLMLPVENMEGNSYVGMTTIGGHEMYIVDWENNLTKLEAFING